MHTILGANGQIANELALELKRNYTSDIRLVSRRPQKVNDTDVVHPADLLHSDQTMDAVKGSEIAYLTVGLPVDTAIWTELFRVIMQNVINACNKTAVPLVFFDNTYMYPQTGVPKRTTVGSTARPDRQNSPRNHPNESFSSPSV